MSLSSHTSDESVEGLSGVFLRRVLEIGVLELWQDSTFSFCFCRFVGGVLSSLRLLEVRLAVPQTSLHPQYPIFKLFGLL